MLLVPYYTRLSSFRLVNRDSPSGASADLDEMAPGGNRMTGVRRRRVASDEVTQSVSNSA